MKLHGKYRLLIEGDLDKLITAGGRNRDLIGYLLQRLLTGETASMSELAYWGISVVECDPDSDEFITIPKHPEGPVS